MGEFKSGFVTIIGRPNAGKSTLLNTVLGQKIAIVSDKPQTTQNKIRGFYTTKDAQIIFIDTPGIHKPRHKLGEFMVQAAKSALGGVDLVFYIVDASQSYGAGEEYIVERLPQDIPVFLLLNKVDLLKKDALLALIAAYEKRFPFAEIFPISALRGENVDHLLETVINYLEPGPCFYPEEMITDQPERAIMAETIREKVLELTQEEIPHAVAVEMIEVKERDNGVVYAAANIYVERESQKGIIVGKKGALLKEIGQRARKDIEVLLGSKVFLELWVKVKKDWRNKEIHLRNFGFDKRSLDE